MDFSVVTAAYNSEKFLDDYFTSLLVAQTYQDGVVNIVLVDDGSSDGTSEVVHKWEALYPGRIQYVKKENGGQGSARNLGLNFAKDEWVTFIDSDDFVRKDYFERVAAALESHPDAVMLACNNIRYIESRNRYTNSHFLKFRFAKGDVFYLMGDDDMPPQHSAALAFFRRDIIQGGEVLFPEDLRISFEDSLFVGRYLKSCREGSVGFLASAKYYARRRADGTSTTDSSRVPGYYLDCLKNGHLVLLNEYSKYGLVPKNIQKTVLYDLVWKIKEHVNGPACVPCLSCEENEQYRNLLKEVFSYIDEDVIESSPGSIFSRFYKIGLLDYFKGSASEFRTVHIEHLDTRRKEIVFRYYGAELSFSCGGVSLSPVEVKLVEHTFLGERFTEERYVRFSYKSYGDVFVATSDIGKKCLIKYKKRQYTDCSIGRFAWKTQKKRLAYPLFGDTWLVSDSLGKADDNGEHFYRYLIRNHPEQRAFYVLERSSKDWARLQAEGFRLLPYGEKRYERELRFASTIISSQILDGTLNYFKDRYRGSKRFVFLQHGITKDDVSAWLNKYQIDLIVTSTRGEHESIVKPGSRYKIFESQACLTGQARHDALLKMNDSVDTEKILLVSPTWRKAISGGLKGETAEREISSSFGESEYCKTWSGLLCSERLKEICDEHGYRVVFVPHPNVAQYVSLGIFKVPDYVEIGSSSWQIEFARSSALVTDYSSNAFEMALLSKPTFYYQFDKATFFSEHTYRAGYFEYARDGFGPTLEHEDALLDAIDEYMNKGVVGETYTRNIENSFEHRDGLSCERIFRRIKEL